MILVTTTVNWKFSIASAGLTGDMLGDILTKDATEIDGLNLVECAVAEVWAGFTNGILDRANIGTASDSWMLTPGADIAPFTVSAMLH